ncbi:MAG: HEPN domain-containing protein [Deltaproteobacteria bacterium]
MHQNQWFELAYDDIDSAKIMLREGKHNIVCYFSHQAAEKGLKGVLEFNGVNPPRTHNLIDLVNLCNNIDDLFKGVLSQARLLNQFYIPTRYPVAPPGSLPTGAPNKDVAQKALSHAETILYLCNSRCAPNNPRS